MEAIQVSAAAIISKGKIFIAQRNREDELANKWEFPGGKIEAHESPEECLKRELFEELGINTQILGLFGESRFDYGHKQVHLLGYFVELLTDEFILHVHQDYKWVHVNEFDQIDWAPADIELTKQLKEKLLAQ
jgi:8-oxo-dGTP diphosphatase